VMVSPFPVVEVRSENATRKRALKPVAATSCSESGVTRVGEIVIAVSAMVWVLLYVND